jgi:hypothetical protein
VRRLIGEAFALLHPRHLPPWMWLAAFVVMTSYWIAFFTEESWRAGLEETDHVVILIGIVTSFLVLIFALSWLLPRAMAHDRFGRPGAFWPWLGWSLLTLVPQLLSSALIFVVGAERQGINWWIEGFVFTLSVVLFMPLFVHATGRAIDRDGPGPKLVLTHWTRRYVPLIAASLIAVLIPDYLAAAADDRAYADGPWAVRAGWVIASSLATTVSFVTLLAVAVAAWRQVPRPD